MSPMRSAAVAGLLFGAMMGLALVAVMLATVPGERTSSPAPVTLISPRFGPGEPVFAMRAPADRGEPSVDRPAIDRDAEPDFGPAHAEAVGEALWLDPGRLDLLAPELIRLHLGLDTLRPQMPRPAAAAGPIARARRPPAERPARRPAQRAARPVARPATASSDPGPAATGPRWPTYLVRARGELPADWRRAVWRDQ